MKNITDKIFENNYINEVKADKLDKLFVPGMDENGIPGVIVGGSFTADEASDVEHLLEKTFNIKIEYSFNEYIKEYPEDTNKSFVYFITFEDSNYTESAICYVYGKNGVMPIYDKFKN